MKIADVNAVELLRRGGALPSSHLTTGHGRHPAPPEILAAKKTSGLPWRKFERTLMRRKDA